MCCILLNLEAIVRLWYNNLLLSLFTPTTHLCSSTLPACHVGYCRNSFLYLKIQLRAAHQKCENTKNLKHRLTIIKQSLKLQSCRVHFIDENVTWDNVPQTKYKFLGHADFLSSRLNTSMNTELTGQQLEGKSIWTMQRLSLSPDTEIQSLHSNPILPITADFLISAVTAFLISS